MFVAGVGHLLAAVTLRQHDFARAVRLQQVDVRIHAACGGRSQRAGGVTVRRLGRPRVVDRMVFDVLGQRFAIIDKLFQLGVGDIAGAMIVPLSDRRVDTGYCDSSARISLIGWLRFTFTASPSPA